MAKITTTHGFSNIEVVVDESDKIFTPANLVTFSGIVALIWAAVNILTGTHLWTVPLLFLWGAIVSDALDGLVAKWTGMYSRVGRIMDPARDRSTILFIGVIMYTCEDGLLWMIPLSLVLLAELGIAYVNKRASSGSYRVGKIRYAAHLAIMSPYITQQFWGYPSFVELHGLYVMTAMFLVSAVTFPKVRCQHQPQKESWPSRQTF